MFTRELLRFALGGLWRQKVRTGLTLVGVTVGTAALAFSLSLGLGLRAFIDREFHGRPDFWRVTVHAAEAAPDKADVPPDKAEVKGAMSDARRARIREVLIDRYLNTESIHKPPVTLTPDKVAAIAALPDVTEVRTYRTGPGRVWAGDTSAPATVVAGRLTALSDRLLAGRLPASDAAPELVVTEMVLYDLGLRDDADLGRSVGRAVGLDVGQGVASAKPMALAQVLTGRTQTKDLSRGESRALEKLSALLPQALDRLDLSAADRAELRALVGRKPDENGIQAKRAGAVVSGEYRIAGVLRLLTREDLRRTDPLAPWELQQGDAFLPPAAGEAVYNQFPWVKEVGFRSAQVYVRPGGDLPGTVDAVEGMGFRTFSALKWFTSAKREVTLIAAGLNLFALAALFVAGVGITNTLVTSVVERTREIGILKAVGATSRQVLGIFLTEGAAIGLLGAAVGLGLARGLAVPADGWVRGLIQKQMQGNGEKMLSDTIFEFPAWLWAGSVAFAVLTTTAAAYYPARRAARVDPIQALKYE